MPAPTGLLYEGRFKSTAAASNPPSMSRSQPVSPGSPPTHSPSYFSENGSNATVNPSRGAPNPIASSPRSCSEAQFASSYARSSSYDGKRISPRFDFNKHSPISIGPQTCVQCPCGNIVHSGTIITPLPTPPYETTNFLPSGPKSAPIAQTQKYSPSYPPRSNSVAELPALGPWQHWEMHSASAKTSPRLRSNSNFSQPDATHTALPGTMHSRDVQSYGTAEPVKAPEVRKPMGAPHEHVTTTTGTDQNNITSSKPERHSFGSRFKSAIKDIFKREPIDESQFERIEDRHWAE